MKQQKLKFLSFIFPQSENKFKNTIKLIEVEK